MEFLQQLPDSFTVGALVGLALGIFSKAAVRFLAIAAGLVVAFELVRMALGS